MSVRRRPGAHLVRLLSVTCSANSHTVRATNLAFLGVAACYHHTVLQFAQWHSFARGGCTLVLHCSTTPFA